jgi:uncharacterized protein (DUF2236 family)
MVSLEQLEQTLATARAHALSRTGDPRAGFFGPDSPAWRVNREAMLLLGGGAAALLQLAHPFVAQAVFDHSRVRSDVAGRFRRTFVRLLNLTFGDLDSASATARRVFAVHSRIGGALRQAGPAYDGTPRYAANDEAALFWVQARLIDTGLRVYEDLIAPLPDEHRDPFYESSRSMCRLFGLSPQTLPADWTQFRLYYDGMLVSPRLRVTAEARELAGHILTPPNTTASPLYRFIRAYTAWLLPETLREGFGLSLGLADRALLISSRAILRRAIPRLPAHLRYFPDYLDAGRRLAGQPGPDRASHAMSRRFLRLLRPTATLRDVLR